MVCLCDGCGAYSCGEGGFVFVINRNTILLFHMYTATFHSPSGCQAEKQSPVISEVISEEDSKSVVLSVYAWVYPL